MDKRNRLAPVSLTVECPVFHLVLHTGFTDTFLLEFFKHTLDRILFLCIAVKKFRVDHFSVTSISFFGDIATFDNFDDINTEFLCEIIVTLIMSRYCHDRTGTITHHYVVCNIDWNLLAINRVDSLQTLNAYTGLIFDKLCSFKLCFFCTLIAVCSDFVHICNFIFIFVDDRMFRSNYHESNTKQSIWSGCIDFKFFIDAINIKVYESPFGFTNPVNLLLLYVIRIIDIFQTFQKFICILCDTQIPYILGFLYNFAVADVTFATLAVLVGKNNFTMRAVIYKCSVSEYKTFFEHFEENPLCPFIIVFICCIDHTVPVKRKSNFF